jgi:hypothetical protein
MSPRPAAILLTLLMLVLPSGALAQSAGDEQYSDPFGEVPADEDKGTATSPDTPAAQEPAPDPVVQEPDVGGAADSGATEPVSPTESVSPTEPASSTESGIALPRTGLPLGVLAGAGALLSAGGFLLRRRA